MAIAVWLKADLLTEQTQIPIPRPEFRVCECVTECGGVVEGGAINVCSAGVGS